MRKRLAVYAGTFDPLTNGHMWMIQQGIRMFDQLAVAIGVNPDKKCLFSLEDRLEMLARSVQDLPGVQVHSFTNQYLINFARSIGADFIIRGIRSESDFEYERTMRNINSDLNPDVTTVFLIPPRELVEVSSSMVKGLVGPEGWENLVAKYVPEAVFAKLKEKANGR